MLELLEKAFLMGLGGASLTAKVEEIMKTRGESLLPYWKKIQDLEARVAALEAEIAKKSE